MIKIPKIIVGLLLLSMLSIAPACSNSEKDKQAHYDQALAYIKNGETDAAILELRNAIQLDGKFGDARYQLALMYMKKENAQKAFAEMVRAADLSPDNIDANVKAAQLYFLARKHDESRKKIESILNKDPENEETLILLANLEFIEHNYAEAEVALARFGSKIDNSARLQILKGKIAAARNNLQDAEVNFKKAIELEGDEISHYIALLKLYEKQREYDETKLLLDTMVQKFPDSFHPHLLLAHYYRTTGQDDRIVPELEKVIEIAPNNPAARLQLAEYQRLNINLDTAILTLEKAVKEIPENNDIKFTLGMRYFDANQQEKARMLLDEIQKKDSAHGSEKLLEARFMLQENKLEDATILLQKLTKDYPDWADPFFFLALAQYSQQQIDQAAQSVTEAIQRKSNESRYHAFNAQLQQLKGDFNGSRKSAITALKLNPKNLRAAILLGRAFIGEKEYKKAEKILAKINKQVPEDAEILESLAIASLGAGDKASGEKALQKLLEIDPGHKRGITLYLTIKYPQNNDKAIAFIQKQLKKAPGDFRLQLVLGGLYAKQGSAKKAIESFNNAMRINPDRVTPYLAKARLLSFKGEQDMAIATYTDLLEKFPNSIPGNMEIAVLYQTRGETEKARKYYEKILSIQDDYAPAANNLSWLIASSPDGDLGKALQLAMLAKQAFPEAPHIADTLGWVHYRRGSYTLAKTQFEQALKNAPDDLAIGYHLAITQAKLGETAEAKKHLKQILEKGTRFEDRENAQKLLESL